MRRRVVITGIGVVSPLGSDRESTWTGLRAGASAVRLLSLTLRDGSMQALGAPAKIVAQPLVSPIPVLADAQLQSRQPLFERDPQATVSSRSAFDAQALDAPIGWLGEPGDQPTRLTLLAERAADEAIDDAGLAETVAREVEADGEPNRRYGCSVGNSKGDLESVSSALDQLDRCGLVDPRLWRGFMPDAIASRLAARYRLGGPVHNSVAACATGLFSVIQAANWIIDDRCDVALAGSADASLLPMVLASYRRLGVLAPIETDDPARAIRPFAADRQGFAVGEGAGMFIVEEAEHARRRHARIHGELAGWASASDAAGLVTLSDEPDALVHCLRTAMTKAEIDPRDVDHVNCHGTATGPNDPWETEGIKRAFGAHAGALRLTANKSMLGHLLGAAGSVEFAMTLLALRDHFVPPTANLASPDPACDLDYTPIVGVHHRVEAAIKQSFGFGGHVAAALVRRWD